jgi:putative hydrolase of the HAD superfamily
VYPALLLDLDETLVEENRAAVASFEATAAVAATHHDIDVLTLAATAHQRARVLWAEGPDYDYCVGIGISSTEGLWCRFDGGVAATRSLRNWAPAYRRETWRSALAAQGVSDVPLADVLSEQFGAERRARHSVFDDVVPALTELRHVYPLVLVTNGASCLQREKLAASGLSHYFDAVVVSADYGVGKPDPAIYWHALSQLSQAPTRAVMIGDSFARDVKGAIAAGLQAIWMNRFGYARPTFDREPPEIGALNEVDAVVRSLPPIA